MFKKMHKMSINYLLLFGLILTDIGILTQASSILNTGWIFLAFGKVCYTTDLQELRKGNLDGLKASLQDCTLSISQTLEEHGVKNSKISGYLDYSCYTLAVNIGMWNQIIHNYCKPNIPKKYNIISSKKCWFFRNILR